VETRRESRLPDPPCGFARYCATPDDPGVLVCVTFIEGDHVVEIMEGEDRGEIVPIEKGMPGVFVPA
jgi:hypothetical protein